MSADAVGLFIVIKLRISFVFIIILLEGEGRIVGSFRLNKGRLNCLFLLSQVLDRRDR